MASQALYLRWRPSDFDAVVGQEHVTATLRSAVASGRVGHAYLFSGPRGTGKTSMARLLAKAVNCLWEDPLYRPCNQCHHCEAVNQGRFLDLIEIDAASHTGVDDVRDLRDRIAFAPNEGRYKVYIIDEVHRFSGSAFDALLKTLEEPPEHAIFILATTEIHKVPKTILSRCQRFEFRRIPLEQIVQRLGSIASYDGISVEPAVLELVARQSTGSLRDAVSLLDQLIAQPGETLTLEMAQAVLGTAASGAVRALAGHLASGDAASGLEVINRALDQGTEGAQFARQMVEYLRLVMLVQAGSLRLASQAASAEEIEAARQHAAQFTRAGLIKAVEAFNTAAAENKGGWQPQLPLEVAFMESLEAIFATPAQPVQAQPQQQPASVPATAAAPPQPEPEPEAPSPANSAPDAPPALPFSEVEARWNDVKRVLREIDKPTQTLLNSGRPVGVVGNVVQFLPSAAIARKLEDEVNRRYVERALKKVFSMALTLRCVDEAKSGVTSQAEDPLLAYALGELGGSLLGETQLEPDDQDS